MLDNKMYNVSVRLNADDKIALEQFAKEHDMSMSQIMRKAIKEYLEKQTK